MAQASPAMHTAQVDSAKRIVSIVYLLQALSIFTGGLAAVVGVSINYVKRNEAENSYLASHMTWQINTFWISLIVGLIGLLTAFIGVGFIIGLALTIWYIYRVVKGYLALSDGLPVK